MNGALGRLEKSGREVESSKPDRSELEEVGLDHEVKDSPGLLAESFRFRVGPPRHE